MATLTGAPVQLVASGWAFETSGAVHLAEDTTAAKADGPGSLRAFDHRFARRFARRAPAIPTDHTLHARWNEGLTVDASNENTLQATFRGDVEADGRPEDGERFQLQADAMVCALRPRVHRKGRSTARGRLVQSAKSGTHHRRLQWQHPRLVVDSIPDHHDVTVGQHGECRKAPAKWSSARPIKAKDASSARANRCWNSKKSFACDPPLATPGH